MAVSLVSPFVFTGVGNAANVISNLKAAYQASGDNSMPQLGGLMTALQNAIGGAAISVYVSWDGQTFMANLSKANVTP